MNTINERYAQRIFMAVTIRLSRVGKIHSPVYRIVAMDARKKRDGEALIF